MPLWWVLSVLFHFFYYVITFKQLTISLMCVLFLVNWINTQWRGTLIVSYFVIYCDIFASSIDTTDIIDIIIMFIVLTDHHMSVKT